MDYNENLTPQYRIEEYLEAIVEGWVDATVVAYPDYPSWRLEEFLDAFITYIWEDGDHPRHPCPDPVWRLEECLRAIYDVMTGAATPWPFPTPTTNRIEEYLAAIHAYLADNTELPVPEPVWRIEQWLAYALDAVKQGGGVVTTVSGTMVHITNALAKAALSVLVNITPIQPGSGDPSPENVRPISGRTGVNVYDDPKYGGTIEWNQRQNTYTEYQVAIGSLGDVSVAVDSNGYLVVNGTPTGIVRIDPRPAWHNLAANHVSLIIADGTGDIDWHRVGGLTALNTSVGKISKYNEDFSDHIRITLNANQTYNNSKIRANCFDLTQMFGSTIADYIYGLEQANTGAGVAWFRNLFPKPYYAYNAGEETCVSAVNGDTYWKKDIDWTTPAGTVYGGTLDVVTGVLTVTHGFITLVGGNEATYSNNGHTNNSTRCLVTISGKANGAGNMTSNQFVYNNSDDYYGIMLGRAANNKVEFYLPPSVSTGVADQKAWFANNPTQLCYELATPLTYQLTAQDVQMLLGENYVWSSSGDTVSVTYYAEGNANPLQSLNILLGGRYSNPKTADDVSDKEALEIILGGNK